MERRYTNSYAKWDMKVMLLEDAIREEKQKIAELDNTLLEHGEEIHEEESICLKLSSRVTNVTWTTLTAEQKTPLCLIRAG